MQTTPILLLLLASLAIEAGLLVLLVRTKRTVEDNRALDEHLRQNREELSRTIRDFRSELTQSFDRLAAQMRQLMDQHFQLTGEVQREKFQSMMQAQEALVRSTERRLDEMRAVVEEKLQQTLDQRIGQSFALVRSQLEDVQKGLGEMRTLAQDVGGLKRVLGNVKMRGTFGEVQLGALLEQMLSPEQYEANVKTKRGATEFVEYAIKLPGRDDSLQAVYLPIDAKFPKDAYEQYADALEAGDTVRAEAASRQLEATLRRMARDIHDKYVDPPFTTDFALLFLPFEGIYAEVVRRTALVEQLQREWRVVVAGPTTLGALLSSLQMGFRTLAIQRRTAEVWTTLGAVKTEFGKFGGLLQKVQKNLHAAGDQLEEVMGKRTRAIERRLRNVEALPPEEAEKLLPTEEGEE
ncbi:MAG: DNA recombination protein RmuC [Bacteroidaceae bacterium]